MQTELLMQAHLTRETAALSPNLQHDFKKMLALAPRLLEELMKVLAAVHNFLIAVFLAYMHIILFFWGVVV